MSFDTVPLHDVAALLKLFLRELPEPLLTSERVNAFIKVDCKYAFLSLLFREYSQVLCSLFVFTSAFRGKSVWLLLLLSDKVVIFLEESASDLHMVQLMPLPPVISRSCKIQNGLPF